MKTTFLVFHLVVAILFTIALVICIGIADGTQDF